jgi:hypothetical protein
MYPKIIPIWIVTKLSPVVAVFLDKRFLLSGLRERFPYHVLMSLDNSLTLIGFD